MELYIDRRTELPVPDRFEDIIKKVTENTLIEAGIHANCEVAVSIVDDAEIRDINKRFRNVDAATDVLSFPLIDFSDCDPAEGVKPAGEGESVYALGDIIISLRRVFSQAEQYGHSPEREMGFLTAHGMLHLLGYDHMTAEDEKKMFSLQEKILRASGLER